MLTKSYFHRPKHDYRNQNVGRRYFAKERSARPLSLRNGNPQNIKRNGVDPSHVKTNYVYSFGTFAKILRPSKLSHAVCKLTTARRWRRQILLRPMYWSNVTA